LGAGFWLPARLFAMLLPGTTRLGIDVKGVGMQNYG
jgi:hypothetical protein